MQAFPLSLYELDLQMLISSTSDVFLGGLGESLGYACCLVRTAGTFDAPTLLLIRNSFLVVICCGGQLAGKYRDVLSAYIVGLCLSS